MKSMCFIVPITLGIVYRTTGYRGQNQEKFILIISIVKEAPYTGQIDAFLGQSYSGLKGFPISDPQCISFRMASTVPHISQL